MKTKFSFLFNRLLKLSVLSFFLSISITTATTFAVDYYWVGSAGSGEWSDSSSWALTDGGIPPAGPPGSTDNAFFTSSDSTNISNSLSVQVNNLTVESGYSGTMAFGTGTTINGNFVYEGSGTFSTPGVGDLTVNGNTSIGNGIINLQNPADFLGNLNINSDLTTKAGDLLMGNDPITVGGELNIGATGSSGSVDFTNDTLTVSGNITEDPASATTISPGGVLLTQPSAASMTISTKSNMGDLEHNDSGTLIIANDLDIVNFDIITGAVSANTYNINMSGSLTLSGGGSITPGTSTFIFDGVAQSISGNPNFHNLTIESSSTLSPGVNTIDLTGDWRNNSGTFSAGTGTVNMSGTNQEIFGSTTFNDFDKTVSTAATLTFPSSTTQTFTGSLTLKGASGQLLSLRSSSDGVQTQIDPQGVRDIDFVDVKDNQNINATPIDLTALTAIDSGNNDGWSFAISVFFAQQKFSNNSAFSNK